MLRTSPCIGLTGVEARSQLEDSDRAARHAGETDRRGPFRRRRSPRVRSAYSPAVDRWICQPVRRCHCVVAVSVQGVAAQVVVPVELL